VEVITSISSLQSYSKMTDYISWL